MKAKALIITPQPFFTPRGTPFSVYYRTLVMSEMEMEIDLVTYGEGGDVDLPNVTIYRIPRFSRLGSVKIGPSLLKLFLDIFILFRVVRLLSKKRYHVVHAHEEAVFFCLFLKPIFRFKLIYDMHSSLPQQLTNFKFTTSKLIISIFKFLEDQALRHADAVITICPDLADYVETVITEKSKHVMIENSIFESVKLKAVQCDQHTVDSTGNDYNSLIKTLTDSAKWVVYAGTLEPYQGIGILLHAFKIVFGKEPEAKLLIVGGAPQQVTDYKQQAKKLGIENSVFFTGRVPQHIAQSLCKMASVQVSPRSAGTNTPLKIYEQLASGIPLVATNIYSHTQTIDDDVAFLVDPEPDAMAGGILKALKSDGVAKSKSGAAKKLYRDKYSRPVYEQKMKKIMRILNLCVGSQELLL